MKKDKIVILGANGNVGSELTVRLAEMGLNVHAVCRSPYSSTVLRYYGVSNIVIGTVDSREVRTLISQAAVVVNCIYGDSGASAAAKRDNVQVLRGMVACAAKDAALVHCSSVSVYGDLSRKPFVGVTAYGRDKLAHESILWKAAGGGKRRIYVLRLGHVLGNIQPLSKLLTASAQESGECLRLPKAGQLPCNCTTAAGIARSVAEIARSASIPSGTYNHMLRESFSWDDVFHMLAPDVRIEALPMRVPPNILQRLHGIVMKHPGVVALVKAAVRVIPWISEDRVRAQHLRMKAAGLVHAEEMSRSLLPFLTWAAAPGPLFPMGEDKGTLLADIVYLGALK
jgi:nucleoside-diphosphate-sugar epimerase